MIQKFKSEIENQCTHSVPSSRLIMVFYTLGSPSSGGNSNTTTGSYICVAAAFVLGAGTVVLGAGTLLFHERYVIQWKIKERRSTSRRKHTTGSSKANRHDKNGGAIDTTDSNSVTSNHETTEHTNSTDNNVVEEVYQALPRSGSASNASSVETNADVFRL